MNTVLREAMDTIQNQTQKSTTEKSIEDTEIENLDKKRKELRQKTNKTLKDKVEYAELNKLVKKKRRTRARRKRKELILETLEARKGPRQINKHRNKQMIMSMRKESGEITARIHLDKLVSTEFQIHRGVRQGDSLSPKLFTAVMEEVFKKAEISEGVNVDGENLSNVRFADDVALLNETTKQMEKHMNNLNSESMKVGLKIHKGKTKYVTNYADSEDILIGQQKIEKVTEFKYLGQTTHLKDTTKEEIYARIRAAWSCFGKKQGNTPG